MSYSCCFSNKKVLNVWVDPYDSFIYDLISQSQAQVPVARLYHLDLNPHKENLCHQIMSTESQEVQVCELYSLILFHNFSFTCQPTTNPWCTTYAGKQALGENECVCTCLCDTCIYMQLAWYRDKIGQSKLQLLEVLFAFWRGK